MCRSRSPGGEICALLGRNGAGKTTTMRLLLGLSRCDRGQARLLGEPSVLAAGTLGRVGTVIDGPAFVPPSQRDAQPAAAVAGVRAAWRRSPRWPSCPSWRGIATASHAGSRSRTQGGLYGAAPFSALNHAAASLAFCAPLLLALVAALFGSALGAADRAWGTLRYLYVQPVTPRRLITGKFSALTVCTALATASILLSGLLVGLVAVRLASLPSSGSAGAVGAVGRSAPGGCGRLCDDLRAQRRVGGLRARPRPSRSGRGARREHRRDPAGHDPQRTGAARDRRAAGPRVAALDGAAGRRPSRPRRRPRAPARYDRAGDGGGLGRDPPSRSGGLTGAHHARATAPGRVPRS